MAASFDNSIDRIKRVLEQIRDVRDLIDEVEDEAKSLLAAEVDDEAGVDEPDVDEPEQQTASQALHAYVVGLEGRFAWRAFLGGHPEIASAHIGQRGPAVFRCNRALDPKLDREYVSWGWNTRSDDYHLRSVWLVRAQLREAVERACSAEGGPVTARRVAAELWGPDAYGSHAHTLAHAMLADDAMIVDRTQKPNRYSLADD